MVTLAAFPATFCWVSCKRSFNSLMGLPLNASRTSPAKKPALAASLVSGTSSRITPVSPGLPGPETAPRPTRLRTFAPAQTAPGRLRVLLRVGVVSLDLEGITGCRAMALSFGLWTPNQSLLKFTKLRDNAGEFDLTL